MDFTDKTLKGEDYIEPRCLLCDDPYGAPARVKPVPQQRIIQKMNDYMSHRDYEGAGRHLLYWYEEAVLGHDHKGRLMICNELVGHYRKTGDREKAMLRGEEALDLLAQLDMEDSISAGTSYVNFATACNAFGDNDRALELFEKARRIYESSALTGKDLLGGLYNNMALVCVAQGDYARAYELYDKAMETMAQVQGGALEQAVTCLNRADAIEQELGMEEGEDRIYDCLDQAEDLLNREDLVRDGYYAFICEKCAPVFQYYGYFLTGEELTRRAEEIYGRISGSDQADSGQE